MFVFKGDGLLAHLKKWGTVSENESSLVSVIMGCRIVGQWKRLSELKLVLTNTVSLRREMREKQEYKFKANALNTYADGKEL